jgi:hypothetical protein
MVKHTTAMLAIRRRAAVPVGWETLATLSVNMLQAKLALIVLIYQCPLLLNGEGAKN